MTRETWRLSYFTPLDFIIHSVDILTHDHSYWQWNVQERPVKSENSEVSCHIFYQRVLYRGYQCLWQIFSVPSAYIALIPRTVYLYGANTTPAPRVFPRRDFPFPEVLSFSCPWWSLAFIACFPVPLSSHHFTTCGSCLSILSLQITLTSYLRVYFWVKPIENMIKINREAWGSNLSSRKQAYIWKEVSINLNAAKYFPLKNVTNHILGPTG